MTDPKVAEAERRVAEAWRALGVTFPPHVPNTGTVLDAAIRTHERAKLVAALRARAERMHVNDVIGAGLLEAAAWDIERGTL